MDKLIKIAPSLLSADPEKLNEEIEAVENFSDLIHVDVMDGFFVPNDTMKILGAPVLKDLKSKLPFDVHLMIENPDRYIDDFAEAGASNITIHFEADQESPLKTLQKIKEKGVRAGVSIRPKTPLESLGDEILDAVDMVLIMTVEPGFGGQEFILETLPKIKKLRELKPDLDIEVDGGINHETAKQAVEAGANILVAGSYIFKNPPYEKIIQRLREAS